MKKKINFIYLSLIIVSIFFLNGCSKTNEQVIKTDDKNRIAASNKGNRIPLSASESRIEWEAKKVTGGHTGTVDISKGEVFIDEGKLSGGNFEIDFTTIKVLQFPDSAMNAKLTGHLKSDDFFSAGKFPTGKFEITSVTPLQDALENNFSIGGNLTIKGITKPVTFPVKINVNGNSLTASADFKLDRTLWDIKFRSGKFYENLGDNLIYDDFDVKLNISAK